MSYYLAPSLVTLRDEINARWPGRDKSSDGWIGDERHQATRSDHNPNSRGSVNALDVDADGVHVPTILAAVQRHPSAHYWIWQRQIADADDGWRPRDYTGSNPHALHVHISIRQTSVAEQDRRPWGLLEDDMDPRDVWYGSIVDAIQRYDADGNPLQGTGNDLMTPGYALGYAVREAALTRAMMAEALKLARATNERLHALVTLTPEIRASWSTVDPEQVDRLPIVPLLTSTQQPAPVPELDYDRLAEALLRRIAAGDAGT